MAAKRKRKSEITTSKKIIIASYIITGVLTITTVVLSVLGICDVTVIGTITGLAWAEVSVSNAFYFSKARKENALKIALSCIEKQPDKSTDIAALLNALGGL